MNHSIKADIKPNDKWLRLVGIPAIALISTFFLSGFFEGVEKLPFWQILLSNLFNAWVGWEMSRLILMWTRKRFPEMDQVKKRLSIVFLMYFFVVIFMNVFIISLTSQFDFLAHYHWTPARFALAIGLGTGIAIIIGSLYEAIYFFSLWKKTAKEKEQLKHENLHSQFESLKNQVNPHFLFNSLNSLSSLIEIDKKRAIEFIHGMSKVYRYILESNEHELNTLQNEVDFIRSYFYLLNTRFGENLKEEIDIPKNLMNKKIPPLTLQILVENAVKHNIVSANKPLFLKIISSADNEISVINNLQKKTATGSSTHFGLQNIQNRYALLNQAGIKINENEITYSVTVPLIN